MYREENLIEATKLIVNVTWLSTQRPANLVGTFLKNASFCKDIGDLPKSRNSYDSVAGMTITVDTLIKLKSNYNLTFFISLI